MSSGETGRSDDDFEDIIAGGESAGGDEVPPEGGATPRRSRWRLRRGQDEGPVESGAVVLVDAGEKGKELDEADIPADLPPGVKANGGNRTIALIAGVAVVALLAGVALSHFIISPAQAAADAEPPEAGLITVPVELRSLSSDVTLRADAEYEDAVEVRIETGSIEGAAVVTGQVPEVGAELASGSVALEVTGRPVIVLPGELPVYRTLVAGSSGPDVLQLKEALASLDLNPGNVASDVYDASTASAVDALYARVGYASPSPGEGAEEGVTAAQESLRSAQESLSMAQAELDRARSGPTQTERIEQDNMVRAAERELRAAQDTGDSLMIANAEDAVRLARAQRDAALAAPDTQSEVAVRDSASRAVSDAEEALALARSAALTPFPASEVVYVASLPRRVDDVSVQRGSIVTGAALRISGAELLFNASASSADAALLSVDMPVLLTVDDREVDARITQVGGSGSTGDDSGDGASSGSDGAAGRTRVVIAADDLSEEDRMMLVGSNVRVRIPVSSTGGAVLAVPVAALSAGPGGESRVEVDRGEEETELVVVETGLAAQGYVEITSSQAPLVEGDRVVVGR